VGVHSIANVCAVSDYWLRSFFGFHCVPFRGTRLQIKHYSKPISDFQNKTSERTGVRFVWLAPVYRPTTTGLCSRKRVLPFLVTLSLIMVSQLARASSPCDRSCDTGLWQPQP
jgi:hypothetical protein